MQMKVSAKPKVDTKDTNNPNTIKRVFSAPSRALLWKIIFSACNAVNTHEAPSMVQVLEVQDRVES